MLRLRIKNMNVNETLHGIQFVNSVSITPLEELFKEIFIDLDIEIFDDAPKKETEQIIVKSKRGN